MQAILITIGDEILNGQTVDTNSAWMGRELNNIGVKVHEILSISDESDHIKEALKHAESNADIILITGGLGPTKDDVTKHSIAEFFGSQLQTNDQVLDDVREIFKRFNRPMLESNNMQALVPENCIAIRNKKGTAPGMWFDERGKIWVSMPGVPSEMKAMMKNDILPRIKDKFTLPVIVHKHLLTAGIGESFLAETIKDFENKLPSHIKLAYLPSFGYVKLRLTGFGTNINLINSEVDEQVKNLESVIPKDIYGYDRDKLEEVVGNLLIKKKSKLSTAESCTGGYIAHLITGIPGSSAYFEGAIVSYSNKVKMTSLAVDPDTLEENGAVSEETVRQMLLGVCSSLKTEYGIAVSGIAGPGGATADKPVGTVWIAVGSPDQPYVRKFQFPGNRDQNIKVTAIVALNLLRKYLLGLL